MLLQIHAARSPERAQDKQKEIVFFDQHAEKDDYDVFTPASNERLPVYNAIDHAVSAFHS